MEGNNGWQKNISTIIRYLHNIKCSNDRLRCLDVSSFQPNSFSNVPDEVGSVNKGQKSHKRILILVSHHQIMHCWSHHGLVMTRPGNYDEAAVAQIWQFIESGQDFIKIQTFTIQLSKLVHYLDILLCRRLGGTSYPHN